jgi:hypothetical protein
MPMRWTNWRACCVRRGATPKIWSPGNSTEHDTVGAAATVRRMMFIEKLRTRNQ